MNNLNGNIAGEHSVSHRHLFNFVAAGYKQPKRLMSLRQSFFAQGYVALPSLIEPRAFEFLYGEIQELYKHGKDRSFTMPGYETPRMLRPIGGQQIMSSCPLLFSLYFHHEVHDLLAALTGKPIFPCEHPEEFFVANFLNRPGATHGWHLDDPPYALVLFFDAPKEDEGGLLEFIPNWSNFCKENMAAAKLNVAKTVELARQQKLVQVRNHNRRDGYFLRADRNLHRVTELTADGARRTVINMAYQDRESVGYAHTADMLYAQ